MVPPSKGFTLIEILAVIAIGALIIAGVIAAIGQCHQNALRQTTQAILAATATKIVTTQAQTGLWPNSISESDAWGQPLVDQTTSQGFTLSSIGPDTVANTSDDLIYEP